MESIFEMPSNATGIVNHPSKIKKMEAVFEKKLAEQSGYSIGEIEELTPHIFAALRKTIAEDPDGRARFVKLGAFVRREVAERTYNNAITDYEDVVKPAHVTVTFTPYLPLREELNPDVDDALLELSEEEE